METATSKPRTSKSSKMSKKDKSTAQVAATPAAVIENPQHKFATEGVMTVFLTGPYENRSEPDKDPYFVIEVATCFKSDNPKHLYSIFNREKAMSIAQKISFDQRLPLFQDFKFPARAKG